MPKKTVSARGGAQRNKPKVQKNIELVRKTPVEQEPEAPDRLEPLTTSVPAAILPAADAKVGGTIAAASASPERSSAATSQKAVAAGEARTQRRRANASALRSSAVTAPAASETQNGSSATGSAPATSAKGSASARLASRREAAQRAQQRAAATMVTSEHYGYVRKDLIFIAILAAVMFAVIIMLHFVPGIGS